jgi:AraC-type DNA-binding domain-containing proteins
MVFLNITTLFFIFVSLNINNQLMHNRIKSRTARNDDFQLEKISQFFYENGDHPFYPHIHSFYQIVWFTKGFGKHYVDFHEYPVEDNMLFFVSPRQIHWFDENSRFDGMIMHFNKSYLSDDGQFDSIFLKYNIFNAFDAKPYFKVSNECTQFLSNIIVEMREELIHKNDFAHFEYLNHLIKLFLIQIQRMGKREGNIQLQPNNNVHCTFVKFRQMIESHYHHTHTVKEYAFYMNITTKTLYNNVMEVAHITPLQMIDDRIILESKRMLKHTSLRVKEIAYQLGFEDSSYFVKFFKKQTGYLPMDFRDSDVKEWLVR